MKRVFFSMILLGACAGASEDVTPASEPGIIYEVTNRSNCTARITLHDLDGKVIDNIKYPDLRAGQTQRYRLPSTAMKVNAVGIDSQGNNCGLLEDQKIQITKIQ